jgi:hypothetical protein
MQRLARVFFSGQCVSGVATVSAADPVHADGNVVLEETLAKPHFVDDFKLAAVPVP